MIRPTTTTLLTTLILFGTAYSESPPNVLVMLTDNQSFYELGCHGHPVIQTPRIDALARESVDFVNFHAPPFCSPSRGVLMTGRYAMRYGIHNTIGGRSILHRSESTLANRLRDAGYRTGVFGKWHLGFSYPFTPQHRGFDVSYVHGGGGIGQLEDHFGNSHIDASYWHNGEIESSQGFSTDVLFEQGLKFIESNKDRPFFAFISTPATHQPWQSHPGALEKIQERGQEIPPKQLPLFSMVENIDENVGRVLDKLDEWNLSENTIVVLATDQGMGNRGAPEPIAKPGRKDHRNAYDESHHVFCMVRYPPLTRQPNRCGVLAGMVDIAPTILDLTGVGPSENMDGRSLRPLLSGADKWKDDRVLIVQCPRGRERRKWHNASVKTQRWRLVGGDELYDVQDDPTQRENVAEDHPQVLRELASNYEAFWNALPDESEILSRHVIGDTPTRLNAMDWYQGGSPWHSGAYRGKANGVWAIEVERAGRYRFEMRHFPREAERPHNAKSASFQIGDMTVGVDSIDDNFADATIDLAAGSYDLGATFELQDGKTRGALFVYVSPAKREN